MTAESPHAATKADQVSPDDLLSGFSKSHLVRWFLAALLLHAIVIGGFSVGTIRDWLDPEGAKARQAAAVAAAKAATAPAEAAAAAQPAEGQASPAAEAKPAEPQAAATAAEAKTPIEQATTEAAKPSEIPTAPDDLGLSIEDTNPN
jgi:predicted lipid-binding transport protein (Tim44 family)